MTNDNLRGLPVVSPWDVLDAATRGEEWVTFGELKRARERLATDLAAAIARAEAWKQAFTIERQRLYISQGMKIEQARIHAENDAAIAAQQAEGEDRG